MLLRWQSILSPICQTQTNVLCVKWAWSLLPLQWSGNCAGTPHPKHTPHLPLTVWVTPCQKPILLAQLPHPSPGHLLPQYPHTLPTTHHGPTSPFHPPLSPLASHAKYFWKFRPGMSFSKAKHKTSSVICPDLRMTLEQISILCSQTLHLAAGLLLQIRARTILGRLSLSLLIFKTLNNWATLSCCH